MAQISAARKAAFSILLAVERGDGHSDDLLRAKTVSKLSPQDRNLATALVLGVLRWQIALDEALRPLLKRPNAKLDPEVLIALRLGAFQLLHMNRIPARAAIDESVELAKHAGHRFASGMVNAVLRKLAGAVEKTALHSELGAPLPSDDKASPRLEAASGTALHASPQYASGHDFSRAENAVTSSGALAPAGSRSSDAAAYPTWMTERWTRFFGEQTTCEVCRHGQSQPALAIRIGDPRVESELASEGIQLAPGALLNAARIVLSGDITTTAALRESRVRIQDEGSQLVAEIAGQGSTILDYCAAPGGKTLILAERNPEARIVACEASAPRLEALQKRVAALGNRVECRLADATKLTDEAAFDLVLADVPCSGTGTLGRNPEIRHRLHADDLARQSERQRLILTSALQAARPGGRVVYSTCSLEPEENEQVIASVLRDHADARVLPIGTRIEQMERDGILAPGAEENLQQSITPEGYLRLFPGAFGTDGFFVAILEKPAIPLS
jgi:16S rRNA (cytosine967-C5)-methyltransferase